MRTSHQEDRADDGDVSERRTDNALDQTTDFSLAEVEHIATEAQLDMSHVHRAIRDLDTRIVREGGIITPLALSRSVEGEVRNEEHALLALELDRALGSDSAFKSHGDVLVWTRHSKDENGVDAGSMIDVTFTPGDGRTNIVIDQHMSVVSGNTFQRASTIGLMVAGLALASTALLVPAGLVGGIAWVAGTIVVCGATVLSHRLHLKHQYTEMESLMSRLAEQIRVAALTRGQPAEAAQPVPNASRRFSHEEVARVVERASELEAQRSPVQPASGLSLLDVEHAASEAGLDPAFVRRAAATLESSDSTKQLPSGAVGAPTALWIERTLDGEIPRTSYLSMASDIRVAMHAYGTLRMLGRTFVWQNKADSVITGLGRAVSVVATFRDGATTIRIEENCTPLFAKVRLSLFIAFLLTCAVWLPRASTALIALGRTAVAVVALLVGIRLLLRHLVRDRGAVQARLVTRLAKYVAIG